MQGHLDSACQCEAWLHVPRLRAAIEKLGARRAAWFARTLSLPEARLYDAAYPRWAERIGARVALRVALRKLAPTIQGNLVEVRNDQWGRPTLHGALPPGEWLISLSHDRERAAALVVWVPLSTYDARKRR
ncbi:MAG: hypothetical protein VYD19_08980 [Myxococcota bacterium]|nr:hypothetical protein [Myxococcota bacterium]